MKISEAHDFFYREVGYENARFVDLSLDIAVRVNEELRYTGKTRQELADDVGVELEVIDRWLQGLHNFTLKEISQLEAALEIKLLKIIPYYE